MARPKLGLVAGYAVSLAGGILSLAMYAHVLGPADYGRLAVYLAAVEALQTVLFQWHRLAAVRFWAQNEQEEFASFLNTYNVVGFGLGGGILVLVGVYAFLPWTQTGLLWPLAIGLGLAKSAALYAQELARAAGATQRYTIGALLLTVGGALFGILAYRVTHTISSILLATTLTFLFSAFICAGPVCFSVRDGKLSARYVREMLRYGLPLIPVFLASTALTRLDRPILSRFEDADIVGVYAATMALISNVVSAAFLLVVTPTYPWLLREKVRLPEAAFRELHATVGVLLMAAALGVCTAFYCARDSVLPLLLGDAIGPAASSLVLPVLVVSLIGAYRAHFFDQAFHVFGKTRSLMLVNIAILIVAMVSLYVGASFGGLHGLLWGLAVANIASLVMSIAASRRLVALRPIARGALRLVLIAAIIVLGSEVLHRVCISYGVQKTLTSVAIATAALFGFASVIYFMHADSLKRILQGRP